jgi:hypothetical protein
VGGILLASSGDLTPPLGGFTPFSVSFTPALGDPSLGQQLRIVLRNPNPNVQIDFDEVSLGAPAAVPEPPSILLFGMSAGALLGVVWYRRGRRTKRVE